MRFYLDENVSIGCLEPLRRTYLDHEFTHSHHEGLDGTLDVALFDLLSRRRYDAIITRDGRQMSNDVERKALYASNIHWIGFKHNKARGLLSIVSEVSVLTAGLIHVLEDWKDDPHVYSLKGVALQATQRLTSYPVWKTHWPAPSPKLRAVP